MAVIPSNHTKEILLIEDREDFYIPLARWLREEGYQVTLAKSYEEALAALEERHFHLAIIDIRLEDDDKENEEGMKLLIEIEKKQLSDVMSCIVLTAYPNINNILTAFQKRRVDRFIQKSPDGYQTELLNAVRELFDRKIRINFDLVYDAGADKLVTEIAGDINWSIGSSPQLDLLVQQVRDLFGKLFVRARNVFISKLKPGLTGAAVVRVQPTWEPGVGPACVTKVGRRDKVETESAHYKEYVEQLLPNDKVTQVDVAYTRHLGMLLYRFAEGDTGPLSEFDQFYQHSQPEAIATSLRNLFQNTCRYWYDHTERKIEDLTQLYYQAFELDEQKLINRIQIVLPHLTPEAEVFQFDQDSVEMTNPIAWLTKYRQECVLPVYQCITHGDLTGRNIMVSERGRCWLIDFYRTYPSHILRDFVILESDIKYRLLPTPNWKDFLKFEETLLKTGQTTPSVDLPPTLPPELQKAGQVIIALRDIAYEFSRGRGPNRPDSIKEYLISLLMTTLNVVRLRHIPEERKLQAMLSAALICNELDTLAGRAPSRFISDDTLTQLGQDQPVVLADHGTTSSPTQLKPTAQQKFLTEYLRAGDLFIFLGSSNTVPSDWPTAKKLAQQLMSEIEYESAPGDSLSKLFDIYSDKIGRAHLVRKLVEYYEKNSPPPFFEKVVTFGWPSVYTTNQHTYLERAYQKLEVPYEEIVSLPQRLEALQDRTPIYKLYGSLSKAHRHDPTTLPLTDTEQRHPEVRSKLQQFLDKLKHDLDEGKWLLMVYPSQEELKLIQEYCRPSPNAGLIWLVGAHYSEEEQDLYRRQDLRVVPNDPSELLSALSVLAQK